MSKYMIAHFRNACDLQHHSHLQTRLDTSSKNTLPSFHCGFGPSLIPLWLNGWQAVLTLTQPLEFGGSAAAVTTVFPDGREQMTSFFSCSMFSADCMLLAHMYLAWGLREMLPGARDAFLSTQVTQHLHAAASVCSRDHVLSCGPD